MDRQHHLRGSHRPHPAIAALAVLFSSLVLVTRPSPSTAATYNVPSPYATIQAAVSAVPTNQDFTEPHTIIVGSGVYREQVTIANKRGTASNRLTLVTTAGAVVDGYDIPPSNQWTQCLETDVWTAAVPELSDPLDRRVFVATSGETLAYTYVPDGTDCKLLPGQYSYDAVAHQIHVNVGGGNPGTKPTFIRVRNRAFYVSGSTKFMTIDGFTVRNAALEGIRADGPDSTNRMQSVILQNLTVAYNGRRGIHLQFATDCLVLNNSTHHNDRHGIYLLHTTHSTVLGNASFQNDDPFASGIAGGTTGIKVGDAPGMASNKGDVYDITVDKNVTYENEDSGIDVKSASWVYVRQNVSQRNGDHGYDNLNTDQTHFLGNVAARNDHDGLSIEPNATNVTISNCIFVQNAVNPTTLADPGYARELAVYNTSGFHSDYNVIAGLPSTDFGDGYYRRLVERPNDERYTTFAGYRDSTAGVDDHSTGESPVFADSAAGRFRPWWNSSAIDLADTTALGWSSTDAAGFARHDCAGKANAGKPTGAYGDVGPLEYSDAMSAVDSIGSSYNTVSVGWTGTGRYGDADYKPIWYKVYVGGFLRRTRIASNMEWPGYIEEIGLLANPCATHNVYVETLAESASAALKDVTRSNTVRVTTCCVPGCADRPEWAAAEAREEEVDVPLTLGWAGENPARTMGVAKWSIPRLQEGAPYDLSVFDLAGRRVMTVARGVAKAGRFAQEVTLRAKGGAVLPSGVFFLRLRVAGKTLSRTVIVTR